MNKLVKNKSTKFLLFMWFFVAAFTADSANLTDIFVPTEHFEECYAPQSLDGIGSQLAGITSSPSVPQHHNVAKEKTVVLKKVLLDQDSPALAAVFLTASHSFNLTQNEEKLTHRFLLLSETLYLRNHTLLL